MATASYDSSLRFQTDQMRFLLRDTAATFIFEDAELAWLLTQEQNVYMAAVSAVALLRGDVKRRKIGETEVEYLEGQVVSWKARGMSHQQPFFGGVSRDERDVLDSDGDFIQPAFKAGMFEHSGGRSVPDEIPTKDNFK
jgi:hypothetical protein